MKRFLWLGFVLLLHLICTGCGDTFRPIIIPNPPTFPNPAAAHSVVAISDNGTTVAGSVMVIDVSGDSIASVADCTTPLCIGIAPVHAVQQTAGQVLVVNQSGSLSKVNFSSITTIANTTTITLPAGSAPNFVAVAPNQTTAYVTLPNLNEVGVVNTSSNVLTSTITVGSNPSDLAVTPDNTKLYVANNGTLCGNPPTPCSFSVSAFNTVGPSSRSISGSSLSSPPLWLSARSDSQVVYVLEANGTLAYISITSTAGPDTLTESTISIPNATTMIYDGNKNRLYIPGGQKMAIVDVTGPVPQLMKTVPIPPFSLLNLASVPGTAVAAAALPDGSRAYVGSYAALPSQVNISSVLGDGTTGTYAYTLTAGHDLTPGVTVTVTGTDTQQVSGFDGTYIVSAIVSGTTSCPGTCFQTSNPTDTKGTTYPVSGLGTGSNLFPQVSVVDVLSNFITKTIGVNGFPDATIQNLPNGLPDPNYVPVCVNNRFRFMMAAGGNSSRAYLSSCDGGNVDIIDTSNDTYNGSLSAPPGSRVNNPPQNPVFLFAGP
jgi:DNA-binding beta-propeller fold protein YncE